MSLTLESTPQKELAVCANGILAITPTFISLPPNSGTGQIISVSSTGFWFITSYPSWITLSQTSGGAGSFNIIVTWNKALDSDIAPRTGSIVFQGFEAVIVNLSQAISPKARGLFSDGANDTVAFSNLDWGTKNTLSCWVDFKTFDAVVDIFVSSNIGSNFWLGYQKTTNLLSVNYSGTFGSFSAVLNTDTIYNITVTRDGNTHKMYVDGVLVGTQNIASGLPNILSSLFKDALFSFYSNMIMYDLKIFDRDLTALEVTDLFGFKIADSCLSNLVFDMYMDSLYKTGSDIYTPELISSNDGLLLGYPAGAKGVVDYLGNDLELVP
jgi:Concanavalin A-like lectin/glucanases superfamily